MNGTRCITCPLSQETARLSRMARSKLDYLARIGDYRAQNKALKENNAELRHTMAAQTMAMFLWLCWGGDDV